VKWLRRLEVGDMPYGAKDEAIHYIDLMPNGLHRQYTSIQECKSVITTPSGGQQLLDKGFYNVTGMAWSGRGKIKRVDVSFDGGNNWRTARLEMPVLSKAVTRFNIDWVWDGSPTIMQSRAMDETGYIQPTIKALRESRGTNQPGDSIVFKDQELNVFLDQVYGPLVQRTVLRAQGLPQVKISIDTQTTLTEDEEVQMWDTVLALNGITMIHQGEKFGFCEVLGIEKMAHANP
jgi:hypothetical protein